MTLTFQGHSRSNVAASWIRQRERHFKDVVLTIPFHFLQDCPDPEQYKELHFKLLKNVHDILKDPGRNIGLAICDSNLDLCKQFINSISIADLEEEPADFAAGHRVRSSVLEYIRARTEQNAEFPLHGTIEKIGSSWDGSKVGQLDEVDTLFVLDPKTSPIPSHLPTTFLSCRMRESTMLNS